MFVQIFFTSSRKESVSTEGERIKRILKNLYNIHNQDQNERRNVPSEAKPQNYSDI